MNANQTRGHFIKWTYSPGHCTSERESKKEKRNQGALAKREIIITPIE
jgi:hypothetical protein